MRLPDAYLERKEVKFQPYKTQNQGLEICGTSKNQRYCQLQRIFRWRWSGRFSTDKLTDGPRIGTLSDWLNKHMVFAKLVKELETFSGGSEKDIAVGESRKSAVIYIFLPGGRDTFEIRLGLGLTLPSRKDVIWQMVSIRERRSVR
jgi:hypothetical protein